MWAGHVIANFAPRLSVYLLQGRKGVSRVGTTLSMNDAATHDNIPLDASFAPRHAGLAVPVARPRSAASTHPGRKCRNGRGVGGSIAKVYDH